MGKKSSSICTEHMGNRCNGTGMALEFIPKTKRKKVMNIQLDGKKLTKCGLRED